jgi:hypothetical protein
MAPGHSRGAVKNQLAIVNAVNRLPVYIAALEEMERRVERIARLAAESEQHAWTLRANNNFSAAVASEDRASALQMALRILRGEP